MRTGIKNAIRAIAFILILAICLLGVNHVLTPKKNPFYSVEPNTMDVLFFGTSMAYCTFNPAVLWNDQGIASYNLGKQQQGISLTYYTMQEAFEYQKPKVAVLETYALSYEYEFPDDLEQGITASSLDDMPLTKTKWDSNPDQCPGGKVFGICVSVYPNPYQLADLGSVRFSTYGYHDQWLSGLL